MLAIEIAGMSHNHEQALAQDEIRQTRLENLGVRFIRFSKADMKYDMINVIRAIEGKVTEILKEDNSVRLPKGFDLSILD